MSNLIIGIDQSIEETGITFMLSPDYYTTYSVCGKGKGSLDRIESIRAKVYDLVKASKDKIVDKTFYAFLEGGSFQSKGQLFTLGQLSGSIIGTLNFLGIKVFEIPPTTLKLFMAGTGAANKAYMMKKIQEKYNIVFTNDNKADSYSLAVLGIKLLNGVSEYREEANVIFNLRQKLHL